MNDMKCPYCSIEMEQGKLRSRGGVFFLPDGETLPKVYSERQLSKHHAIALPPYILQTKPEFPTVYVCRKCGKMIVPLDCE